MSELRFEVVGAAVETAAAALRDVLGEAPRRLPPAPPAEDGRKAVDPLALTAVILALPPAILAVVDLADRIAKRRKAQALIATAHRLHADHQTQTFITAADGTRHPLDQLTPDQLLDIANQLKRK